MRIRIPDCQSCGIPVLELEGQFDMLDSYYLTEGMAGEHAGVWHNRCLQEADPVVTAAWREARLRNWIEVRGNRLIATTASWAVVENPRTRERTAFGPHGEIRGLERWLARRPAAGGFIAPVVDADYNLHLGELRVEVPTIARGTYALLDVLEALGAGDRVVHREALEDGILRIGRGPAPPVLTGSLRARMEYGVFVPEELRPYLPR